MVQNLNKYKHISQATDEALQYIDNRRQGKINFLQTKWPKFNDIVGGGLEPNTIITVAGISGSGKSSFVNTLETDLIDLNPTEEIVVLSFSLEMISYRQIGRKLSYKMKRTTKELYSGFKDKPLDDKSFEIANNISYSIKKYPVYYVESPDTIEGMKQTINEFLNESFVKGKWLIVILDHAALTKTRAGISERENIANLQKLFIDLKKVGKTTIIQLSQLNRDIEDASRQLNSNLHFPTRRDLYMSDSIYHTSDVVVILHRPELLLQSDEYGPNSWPTKGLIYAHFIKVREGEPGVIRYKNNLKFNSLEEL